MNKEIKALYDELTEELKFNPHELDKAILNQSVLYQKVHENYAISCSQRDALKKLIEEVYAQNSLRIRDQANTEGKKLTEDVVKQLTLLDPDYQEVTTAWLDSKLDSELWGALKESYSSRGYMIKEMAELWMASYFATNAISSPEHTSGEVQHQQARAAMTLKRRERNPNV
jgi:hypothetical protein